MAIALLLCAPIAAIAVYFFTQNNKNKIAYEKSKTESDFLRQERQKLEEKSNFLQQQNLSFEKENEVLKQNKILLEEQRQQWQKDKEVMLYQLAEELLKKNNQQQEKSEFERQQAVKKITENLMQNFEQVTNKLSALNDEVKKTSEMSNLTQQALLNPASAGRTAEITMENILANSGLRQKQDFNSSGDYLLQSHFSHFNYEAQSSAKRPDAILFFPGDQLAVIDSKSSPHFLELEIARQKNDFAEEKIILAKLKESFRKHLESLRKKEYANFLVEEMRKKNASEPKILIIMFLQTEKMLEILRSIDAEFEQKALEAGIIVASPIGLVNFLSQARIVIDRIKQEKNIDELKVHIRKLIDNVALIFKESKDLGKSLNKALLTHNKMTKTLNRGVYSAVKNISELGITGKKSAEINLLEEFEINEEEENSND